MNNVEFPSKQVLKSMQKHGKLLPNPQKIRAFAVTQAKPAGFAVTAKPCLHSSKAAKRAKRIWSFRKDSTVQLGTEPESHEFDNSCVGIFEKDRRL